MQPAAFLDLAETMMHDGDSEAVRRTVASRAYYAAFHHAVELLALNGVSLATRSTHEDVARHIEHLPLVDAGQQAQWLRDLRSERHHADYQIGQAHSRERTTKALVKARRVCAWMRVMQTQH